MEENTITWKQLGIESWLENHLTKLNMKYPTVIQQNCIPPTIQNKNVIGMAQTGTGKTASFALPIIQHLAKDIFGIFALIITPTRELAQQIKTHFEVLAGDLPLRVALITGGQSFLDMAAMLDSRPHVVVGTPGMIEGAMRRFYNDNYFKRIKYLVFDEADQLLKAEYALDVECILKACNSNRQTLLYSATMDKHVKKLAQMALKKKDQIFIYDACKLYKTADNLKQYYMFIPEAVKDCYLYELIRHLQKQDEHVICIVFFSELEKCELVMRTCKKLGIKCDALHSGKPQAERFQVLDEFKNRRLTALFCTDVANRGLDIPSISYVINYDLPSVTKNYVHRVGRTARAGQSGVSISLVSQFDVKRIKAIEKDIGLEMELFNQITEEDAEQHMYDLAEKRCQAKIDMLDSGFVERYATVQENRKKSRETQETAKVNYEQAHLQQLKQKFKRNKQVDANDAIMSNDVNDEIKYNDINDKIISNDINDPTNTSTIHTNTSHTPTSQNTDTKNVYKPTVVGDVTLLKKRKRVPGNQQPNKKPKLDSV